jgi:hypothetical protein
MSGISSDEIRKLVREALRELVPSAKTRIEASGGTLLSRLRAALADPKLARVEVKADNEADLTAFARDILQASEDIKAGVLSGKIKFNPMGRVQGVAPVQPRTQHQIQKGVVTEVMIAEIGKTSDRLIIGKGVVVTPLARDRAREVKLEIVRDHS